MQHNQVGRPKMVLVALLPLVVAAVAGGCSPPTPAPTRMPTPTPTPIPATAPPAATAGPSAPAADGLTVEEYPLVPQAEDRPDRLEFRRRVDPEILDRRRSWRGFAREGWLDRLNLSLAPFGYRLVGNERSDHPSPLHNLLRGDDLLLRDVALVWPIALNARGDDFALVVEARQGGQWLIRPRGVEKWDPMGHAFTRPVFVENDLVTVEMDRQQQDSYSVLRGGETAHRFQAQFMVDNPVKGLWSWGGRWVLEVDGRVLVDGKSLNQEMGYDEVFGWRLLRGEPLYFFRKGSRIGISYAGRVLPNGYREVIHYMCCEPAAFNLAGNDTMVWFYALKEGTWCYVEAGVYQ